MLVSRGQLARKEEVFIDAPIEDVETPEDIMNLSCLNTIEASIGINMKNEIEEREGEKAIGESIVVTDKIARQQKRRNLLLRDATRKLSKK